MVPADPFCPATGTPAVATCTVATPLELVNVDPVVGERTVKESELENVTTAFGIAAPVASVSVAVAVRGHVVVTVLAVHPELLTSFIAMLPVVDVVPEPLVPLPLLPLLVVDPTGFPAEPLPPPHAVNVTANSTDTNKVQLRIETIVFEFSFILRSNSVFI